jgi:hypothetical protein
MKKVWRDASQKTLRMKLHLACVLLAALAFTGCKALPPMPLPIQDLGPSYKPTNVYRNSDVLPASVRRVAVLPLTMTHSGSDLEAGIETLEPVLYSELEKLKRFEVIPVTRINLQQWTGQNGWRSDEQLPPDLFKRVSEMTGCDAVLFCQLTRYQPYQPLAVGWKFTLVETHNPGIMTPSDVRAKILWSADELMDAGDPPVTTGARAYYTQHLRNDAASADPATVLASPARFGQYTLATVLATIPNRFGEKH